MGPEGLQSSIETCCCLKVVHALNIMFSVMTDDYILHTACLLAFGCLQGTIRQNLDPLGLHSDRDKLMLLNDVGLWDIFAGLNFTLALIIHSLLNFGWVFCRALDPVGLYSDRDKKMLLKDWGLWDNFARRLAKHHLGNTLWIMHVNLPTCTAC